MKALASEFGIDRPTVPSYLRARRCRDPPRRPRPGRALEAARLYEAGWSSGRLAEQFDVSTGNVLKVLRQAGIPIGPGAAARRPSSKPSDLGYAVVQLPVGVVTGRPAERYGSREGSAVSS
jgi:hypothetical protein